MKVYAYSFLLALVAALSSASSMAEVPLSRCAPRTASDAGPNGATFTPLPDTHYTCLRLDNGRHVLVAETGDRNRQAVLLVHGLGNNGHRDWRTTLPALAPHFRVVAVDLPGFGYSEAPPGPYSFDYLVGVLTDINRQLRLQRMHLVGHSMGAAASLHFAHRHPQLVDRLVLVNAAGILLEPVFLRHLAEANAAAIGLGSLDNLMGLLGGSQQRGSFLDWFESQPGLIRMLVEHPSMRRAFFGWTLHADAALGLLEHDFTAAIRDVAAPTTLIWGRGDTVTPLRAGRLLAARMQDARLEVIEGAQHMPMYQTPGEFNTVLRRLLTHPPSVSAEASPPAPSPSQGDVFCAGQSHVTYTGTFDSITLEDCRHARIENAHIGHLRALRSSATLENIAIASAATALHAETSQITATVGSLEGSVGIIAIDSRVDLAGVTVLARRRAVEANPGARVFFSVSHVDSPQYRGDAHFIWPPPLARQVNSREAAPGFDPEQSP